MKSLRIALLLGSFFLGSLVQAQTASSYPKSKNQLIHRSQQKALHDAVKKPKVTVRRVVALAQPQPQFQPEEEPNVLPKGARVRTVDPEQQDFYILSQDDPDPAPPLEPTPKVEVDATQLLPPGTLPPSNSLKPLLSFNSLAHIDDILSQIAHKVVGGETTPIQKNASAVTTAAKPLPKAEKNGPVADVELATDKAFETLNQQQETVEKEALQSKLKPVFPSLEKNAKKRKEIAVAPHGNKAKKVPIHHSAKKVPVHQSAKKAHKKINNVEKHLSRATGKNNKKVAVIETAKTKKHVKKIARLDDIGVIKPYIPG